MLCDGTTQSIESIQVGDWVWSRDSDTGEFGCREVVGLMVTPEQPVLSLEVSTSDGGSDIFGVTTEHPFRVVGEGWKAAGELVPGDEIFTSAGGWMRVRGSSWRVRCSDILIGYQSRSPARRARWGLSRCKRWARPRWSGSGLFGVTNNHLLDIRLHILPAQQTINRRQHK